MKKFYVWFGDFSNIYDLVWAETPEQAEEAENNGYERITRKEAENLCAQENRRRKENPSFSGYASNVIYPVEYVDNWENDEKMYKNRYIIEYI